ncbi:hypothetical protein BX600DRAFT_432390 [Xylariales sp. PMI_506]|nr:hypothetical protein BX600DRAFT_432390 [Xylariales sp. PMI_506]
MDTSGDPSGPSFGYDQELMSVASMDKFGEPPSAGGSQDHPFGAGFLMGYSPFDTIEPATLQLPHTSHDDSCIDACPGAYNAHGLPRGSYPAAAQTRPRFSVSSCSYPHPSPDTPTFQAASDYDQMYSFMSPDSVLKFPMNLGGKLIHHANSSSQHYPTAILPNGFCNIPQCPVAEDCMSKNCSQFSCSDVCCTTEICDDESCEDQGIPCGASKCLAGCDTAAPFDYNWDLDPDLNSDWAFSQHGYDLTTHSQHCNHTNTEHDVALTLRDLKEPGTFGQTQQPSFNAFDCPVFDHHDHDILSSSLPPLPATSDTKVSIQTSPKPCLVTSISSIPEQFSCQWILRDDGDEHGDVCGQTFSNSEELHEHLGSVHVGQMTSKTKYLCRWRGCSRKDDKNFASRNKLKRHISTHTSYKPFKCEGCGEGFSAQQALDQHIRIHTGETPYKCDVPGCGKSFKQKSALTMHKRTHTGEKPLVCEECGKRFCESSNLSKHRKIHAGEYKFKCDKCPRSFIRVDQLRRHALKHARDYEKSKIRTKESTSPELPIQMDTASLGFS